MHERLSLEETPPVPWVRERDIDLLLAELLSSEPSLTSWLLDRTMRLPTDIPNGAPASVRAVVNYSRPHAKGNAAGETDVVVSARYPGGELVISIEDKVWAPSQRDQGKRHRAFVESCGAEWGLALLIAPEQWITSQQDEARDYHFAVSLEEIAEWCDSRAFNFQAEVCRQACERPNFALAPDLQDWHTAVDNLLKEEVGLRLEPQRYVRARNEGRAKPNRWASCTSGTLEPLRGAGQPWLTLKPSSTNHPTRAVIEISKAPADLVERLSDAAHGAGFSVRVTRAGTLLVERHVLTADEWTVAAPFDDQIGHIREVGQAAIELREWWMREADRLNSVVE